MIWELSPPECLVIDFDATLVTSHSDKQDAGPTYKGGFGFHPLGTWCDATSEPLGAMLRPGNAGANDTDDHLELLDQAICSLPPEYRVGHQEGDDPKEVLHEILVRADSATASHRFCGALSDANIDFSIGFRVNGQVRDALLLVQEEDWVRAIEQDSTCRPGAWVYELTELVDLGRWPEHTRLICHRDHPRPRGPAQPVRHLQKASTHLFHHQYQRSEDRAARTTPPRTCEGRRQGAHLEGLRAQEPPIRGLHRAMRRGLRSHSLPEH